jgi:hypothetical protein
MEQAWTNGETLGIDVAMNNKLSFVSGSEVSRFLPESMTLAT